MEDTGERRTEKRLNYCWPVWFAENFDDVLIQGQMADVSSRGAAFTCYADETCPYPGQYITARFSVPCYGPDESFDMANFTRSGRISRVDSLNPFLRRIAIEFAQPLPFRPGEQSEKKTEQVALETLQTTAV